MSEALTIHDYAALFHPKRKRRMVVFAAVLVLVALCVAAVVVVDSPSDHPTTTDPVLFFTMSPHPPAAAASHMAVPPPPLPPPSKTGKQAPTPHLTTTITTTKEPTVSPTYRSPTTASPSSRSPTAFPSSHSPTAFPSSRSPTSFSSSRSPTAFPSSHSPTAFPSSRSPTAFSSSHNPTASPLISVNRIQYVGGAVLTHPVVYVIWYGNWSSLASRATVAATERFLGNLNSTPYNSILSSYYSVNATTGNRTYVSNTVGFGGSVYIAASPNSTLSKSNIHSMAADAIVSHLLPFDTQGIYFVLTSSDVLVVGMCASFCGWHSVLSVPGQAQPVAMAFAALAAACPAGCAPPQYFQNAVNGQLTDGLINVISHEMCESASDPFGNGWKSNTSHAEIADLCEWTYMSGSSVHTDPVTGGTYNLDLSGNKFTVQGEWLNVDGSGGGNCALSA